jgi:hypothetical protein
VYVGKGVEVWVGGLVAVCFFVLSGVRVTIGVVVIVIVNNGVVDRIGEGV